MALWVGVVGMWVGGRWLWVRELAWDENQTRIDAEIIVSTESVFIAEEGGFKSVKIVRPAEGFLFYQWKSAEICGQKEGDDARFMVTRQETRAQWVASRRRAPNVFK